jgi:hypothetical protein
MTDPSYDPTEYRSAEEAARSHMEMDREFGMPSKPYTGEFGKRVNELHAQRETEINNEWGWGRTTPKDVKKRWGLD